MHENKHQNPKQDLVEEQRSRVSVVRGAVLSTARALVRISADEKSREELLKELRVLLDVERVEQEQLVELLTLRDGLFA
jgi:hypothetical protein